MSEPGLAHDLDFDCLVIGGGPAGLTAALALALTGARTAVVVPPLQIAARPADTRTAALLHGSIALLRRLGVWGAVQQLSAPLSAIRIVDGTGALLRAPDVHFRAAEAGLDTFGWNVPNAGLVVALEARARAFGPRLVVLESAGVSALQIGLEAVTARTLEGTVLSARLAVGADGRNSFCRTAASFSSRSWSYDQTAIACRFAHGAEHGGVSTEFHTTVGPCTTVPLPGRSSSLVWVDRPATAGHLVALNEEAFRHELAKKLSGRLGAIGEIGPRTAFPLTGAVTEPCAKRRVALVGEAAHVLPPIGAQGLNLSMRDAATLADVVGQAHRAGRDIGGRDVLHAYASARAADVSGRSFAVDVVNRSLLLSRLPPVHLMRGAGLAAISAFGPLRRAIMRQGLEPQASLPPLMQGVA